MTNKNYNSGRQYEYRVKKYLEKLGYYVMRSAGSKSPFDLIAIPIQDKCDVMGVLLIQCKHGTKISKKEKDDIIALDKSLLDSVYCIIAWSKARGKIEFEIYHYGEEEWTEMRWLM